MRELWHNPAKLPDQATSLEANFVHVRAYSFGGQNLVILSQGRNGEQDFYLDHIFETKARVLSQQTYVLEATRAMQLNLYAPQSECVRVKKLILRG